MKKLRKTIRFISIMFAAILVSALPFQAFAYTPSITAQSLPEAVVGTYYQQQLFAAGFGRNVIWSAQGLPDGMEIDPEKGIIFGTAKASGEFEVLITVKSKWKIRPKTDTKPFLLRVLPLPAAEPNVPVPDTAPLPAEDAPKPVADTPPQESGQIAAASQSHSNAETIAEAASHGICQWISLQANGKSGAQTTTELYFTFSKAISFTLADLKIAMIIEDDKAVPVSFSFVESTDHTYRYALGIELDASVVNGDNIAIVLEDLPNLSPNAEPMSVTVYVATDESRVALTFDELMQKLLLGINTSADEITADLALPFENTEYECDITWSSQYPEIISNTGTVTRPEYEAGNLRVTLTARISRGEKVTEKAFAFTVLAKEQEIIPEPPEQEIIPDPPEQEAAPEVSEADILPEPPVQEVVPSPPEDIVEAPTLPAVASSKPDTSRTKSSSEAARTNTAVNARTSSNVDKSGALNRSAIVSELQSALQDIAKLTAVVRTENAKSISPATLKALALAAESENKRAVIHADTMMQIRKVDARLYLTPASLVDVNEPIKLGIATRGGRPEAVKQFFEKHFANSVSVISCEQKGSFGARLQIAAKVELPEDIGNLMFYSYNAETNTFSRILTAYRIDANGYLRFTTELAGDIIISNGALKKC